VTSLADSGPGTLREAVERPEPADVRGTDITVWANHFRMQS
jgi:hypothetical protein